MPSMPELPHAAVCCVGKGDPGKGWHQDSVCLTFGKGQLSDSRVAETVNSQSPRQQMGQLPELSLVQTTNFFFRKIFSNGITLRRRWKTSLTKPCCPRWCRSRTSAGRAEPNTRTWWTRTRRSSTRHGRKNQRKTSNFSCSIRLGWNRRSRNQAQRRNHDFSCLPYIMSVD